MNVAIGWFSGRMEPISLFNINNFFVKFHQKKGKICSCLTLIKPALLEVTFKLEKKLIIMSEIKISPK